MRTILAARDVHCPVCDAAQGQPCIFHSDPARRGTAMITAHTRRSWAAQDAQNAMRALLGED